MSSSTTFPAVHGPGDFLLHHWHNSDTSLGFRLPLATDFTMHDVTVVIAPWSDNFTLDGTVTTRGLAAYVAIDGNRSTPWRLRPRRSPSSPAPSCSTGTPCPPAPPTSTASAAPPPTVGPMNPDNHFLIEASLSATYAEGAGCAVTAPALPTLPAAGACEVVLGGRATFPLESGDITGRDKFGTGGRGVGDRHARTQRRRQDPHPDDRLRDDAPSHLTTCGRRPEEGCPLSAGRARP